MRSFVETTTLDPVPAHVVRLLADVDRGQGREDLYRHRSPQRLSDLSATSRVASARTSSAIEGIVVPRRRAEAVLADHDAPRNENELELDGYRRALDDVYDTPLTRLDVPRLLYWHRLLKQHTEPDDAGRLKVFENAVYDNHADGRRVERFRPVRAAHTQEYLVELCERYEHAVTLNQHHPLIMIAAVTLDFLTIHPFHDGNGRISRIMTNALAVRHGYEVVRYQSFEQLIANHQAEYLDALADATIGWHDSEHRLWPWVSFLATRFHEAYEQLDQMVTTPTFHELRERVRQQIGDYKREFSIADLRRDVPLASDSLLREELRAALEDAVIVRIGMGRGSKYQPSTRGTHA